MTLWQSANPVRAVGESPVVLSPLANVFVSLSSVMVFRIVVLMILQTIVTFVFCGMLKYLHKRRVLHCNTGRLCRNQRTAARTSTQEADATPHDTCVPRRGLSLHQILCLEARGGGGETSRRSALREHGGSPCEFDVCVTVALMMLCRGVSRMLLPLSHCPNFAAAFQSLWA